VAVTIVTERDVELVQVIEKDIGVELVEMELPEETVLEKMNAVSLARRMATMVSRFPLSCLCHYPHLHLLFLCGIKADRQEMHDSGFGERQATNKAKAVKRAKRDAAK